MNPMKLSHLLVQRSDLLRQVRLANLAFAYHTLREFSQRVARGQLRGRVTLKPVDPAEERYCVTLTALETNQSLIEEHFSDEDLLILADVLGFATGHPAHELTFQIDQLHEFIDPLRVDLERAGVALDRPGTPLEQPQG